jgi:hypothetical protein
MLDMRFSHSCYKECGVLGCNAMNYGKSLQRNILPPSSAELSLLPDPIGFLVWFTLLQ